MAARARLSGRSAPPHGPPSSQAKFDIITGVSAGAINAVFLASRHAPLKDVIEELNAVWQPLRLRDVMQIDAPALVRNVLGWGRKLVSGGGPVAPRVHGLVDTAPLREVLERLFPLNSDGEIIGVAENIVPPAIRKPSP